MARCPVNFLWRRPLWPGAPCHECVTAHSACDVACIRRNAAAPPREHGVRVSHRGAFLDQKGYAIDNPHLWRAVLLNAGLHCLFSMASSMNCIAAVGVSTVCRGFVASSLVMFGGYRRRD